MRLYKIAVVLGGEMRSRQVCGQDNKTDTHGETVGLKKRVTPYLVI